jgi:peptide/nickel transport system ATP-binding protein
MSTRADDNEPVLAVEGLTVEFRGRRGVAKVVDGVDWRVRRGETLAVVGESGSGKSMTALAATGLAPRGARVGGSVRLLGEDLLALPDAERRRARGRSVGFVYQDPMTSLNPVMTVGRQVAEAREEHLGASRSEARARAVELLGLVGIPSPEQRVDAYPHQFSGGMRQRVVIAMALATDPVLLVADEATTALDVTTQAQVLELVASLQERLGTAVVWITHDLGVVAGIADRVAVMYGGRVVEHGTVDAIFAAPAHPYTRALLAARPTPGTRADELATIAGTPPLPTAMPPGCAFWPRCPVRGDARCATEEPPLVEVSPGHSARTFYALRPAEADAIVGSLR